MFLIPDPVKAIARNDADRFVLPVMNADQQHKVLSTLGIRYSNALSLIMGIGTI